MTTCKFLRATVVFAIVTQVLPSPSYAQNARPIQPTGTPVLLAGLRPKIGWERVSPTHGNLQGPVLYQILFRSNATPGHLPKIAPTFTLTDSLLSEAGGQIYFGGLVNFAPGQIFPGSTTTISGGTYITIGGTASNPTIDLNTSATDGRYATNAGLSAETTARTAADAKKANLLGPNTFTGDEIVNGSVTANASVGTALQANSNFRDGMGVSALVSDPTGLGFPKAIYALNSSPSGDAINARAIDASGVDSAGNQTAADAIDADTRSPNGVAIFGDASNASDAASGTGVLGETESPNGFGVFGLASDATGGTSGTLVSIGLLGQARGPHSIGVSGRSDGIKGVAGSFNNAAGESLSPPSQLCYASSACNVLIAQANDTTVFRVDGKGDTHTLGAFLPGGADFAESVAVLGSRTIYAPGDVLVIDPAGDRRLAKAHEPYSTLVAGIVSTKPGVLASLQPTIETDVQRQNEVPLAVVGIVPCKVSTENGPIHRGDLLVTSSTSGYAMRGSDRLRLVGAVVGKAMQPLESGKGVIEVLVTLQ